MKENNSRYYKIIANTCKQSALVFMYIEQTYLGSACNQGTNMANIISLCTFRVASVLQGHVRE